MAKQYYILATADFQVIDKAKETLIRKKIDLALGKQGWAKHGEVSTLYIKVVESSRIIRQPEIAGIMAMFIDAVHKQKAIVNVVYADVDKAPVGFSEF